MWKIHISNISSTCKTLDIYCWPKLVRVGKVHIDIHCKDKDPNYYDNKGVNEFNNTKNSNRVATNASINSETNQQSTQGNDEESEQSSNKNEEKNQITVTPFRTVFFINEPDNDYKILFYFNRPTNDNYENI